jgi:hypothetical protein
LAVLTFAPAVQDVLDGDACAIEHAGGDGPHSYVRQSLDLFGAIETIFGTMTELTRLTAAPGVRQPLLRDGDAVPETAGDLAPHVCAGGVREHNLHGVDMVEVVAHAERSGKARAPHE